MARSWGSKTVFYSVGILSLFLGKISPSFSQSIVPDTTLGAESSQVLPGLAGISEIQGGATRGSQLFHSFDTFGIPAGETGYFIIDNPSIQNVLARVTGSQISEILGTLGTRSPNALQPANVNLFLMNPNGIVFGPNARLDIGKSFAATTANQIQFENQGFFSTTQTPISPLLTVQPNAFIFTQSNPAKIQIQSGAISLLGEPSGLIVKNGQHLLFAGGEIELDNGVLIAKNGRIDLAAIAEPGLVQLNFANTLFQLGPLGNLARGNITLANQSGLNVSGDQGGDIAIQARDVRISGGSILNSGIEQPNLLNLFGGGNINQSGDITIEATGKVQVVEGSTIANGTLFQGNGGQITISGQTVEILSGANIGAVGNGTGNTGDIVIEAQESIALAGQNEMGPAGGLLPGLDILFPLIKILLPDLLGNNPSAIVNYVSPLSLFNGLGNPAAPTAGNVRLRAPQISLRDGGVGTPNLAGGGDTGNIEIFTNFLEVTDGARLISSTNGPSDAGDIRIAPFDTSQIRSDRQVRFDGKGVVVTTSVNSEGIGRGGDLTITTDQLSIINGAQLQASTLGTGDAGSIRITASDSVSLNNEAVLLSDIAPSGIGSGGDIVINTRDFEMQNGSVLRSSTFGQGDAGTVQITTTGRFLLAGESAIFSDVRTTGVGNAGSITLNADQLTIQDNAQVVTETQGLGNAGNVFVVADNALLQNRGSIFSGVRTGGVGNGGAIRVNTAQLTIVEGAQIATATEGVGDAGSVTFAASDRILISGTTTSTGRSSAIFTNNGTPTVSRGTGRGGEIRITTPQLIVRQGAVINAQTVNAQPGGNIILTLDNLQLLNGGQILSTSDGDGPSGNVQINATQGLVLASPDPNYLERRTLFGTAVAPLTDNSGIYIRATGKGFAGDLIIGDTLRGGTPSLRLSNRAEIIADSNEAAGGNITLNLYESLLMSNNSFIGASAGRAQGAGNGGSIVINSPFVFSLPGENNDIIANAFSGTGGEIIIDAQSIRGFELQDEPDVERLRANQTNDITVNSEQGSSGTLELEGFNVDPSRGTFQLPVAFNDPSNQIDRSCDPQTTRNNRFIITGRGGIPLSPDESYAITLTPNWVSLSNTPLPQHPITPHTSNHPPIQEATHWHRTSKGHVQLIASAPVPSDAFFNSDCQHLSQN